MKTQDHPTAPESKGPDSEKWILWLVISLIGAGLLFSSVQFVYNRFLLYGERSTLHKHTLHSLTAALSQFHTEYGPPPYSAEDLATTTDAAFMRPLLGLDSTRNPRHIKFIDFPLAKNGRFGLTSDPPILLDAWGQPYHVILDNNGDGKITHPERGSNPGATDYLTAKAILFSSGPDRDPKTWQDNITTWR